MTGPRETGAGLLISPMGTLMTAADDRSEAVAIDQFSSYAPARGARAFQASTSDRSIRTATRRGQFAKSVSQ